MNTALSLRRAVRLAIGGAVALATPFAATAVLAQADATEEVVVTGSRIARGSDFENPSPVQTVDRDAIERSGYNNLQQLMEKIPKLIGARFTTRNGSIIILRRDSRQADFVLPPN